MPSHDKKSAAELRAELRALRKEKVKPVSRMRVGDISREIELLKNAREETPLPAATPSQKPRQMAPAVESIKKAKSMEFPIAPASGTKKGMERKTARKAYEDTPTEKKKSKADRLMAMLAEMTDSEDD